MAKCDSQRGQGYDGMCVECGEPIAASGCDGGSWVHVSTAPDRVVQSGWAHGKLITQRLANGVIIRYKNGGFKASKRG